MYLGSTRSLCGSPLFSAETAAEQFLFPFCLQQSPGALLPFSCLLPVLLLSSSLAESPSLVSPSIFYSNPIFFFFFFASLPPSVLPSRRQTANSLLLGAFHLTDLEQLSQHNKCDLLILWRGIPGMQAMSGISHRSHGIMLQGLSWLQVYKW